MTDRRQPAPVMVPVLVSFEGTAEVMVAANAGGIVASEATVRTALAYIIPEGVRVERVHDWEELPS